MSRLSTLEVAQNDLDKLNKKLRKLHVKKKSLTNNQDSVSVDLQIKIFEHQRDKALLILIGKKIEQGGRDLVKASKAMENTPGELNRLIEIINTTPKKRKDFRGELNKPDLEKSITKIFIDEAVANIIESYDRLLEFTEYLPEETDDEDEDDELEYEDL